MELEGSSASNNGFLISQAAAVPLPPVACLHIQHSAKPIIIKIRPGLFPPGRTLGCSVGVPPGSSCKRTICVTSNVG